MFPLFLIHTLPRMYARTYAGMFVDTHMYLNVRRHASCSSSISIRLHVYIIMTESLTWLVPYIDAVCVCVFLAVSGQAPRPTGRQGRYREDVRIHRGPDWSGSKTCFCNKRVHERVQKNGGSCLVFWHEFCITPCCRGNGSQPPRSQDCPRSSKTTLGPQDLKIPLTRSLSPSVHPPLGHKQGPHFRSITSRTLKHQHHFSSESEESSK